MLTGGALLVAPGPARWAVRAVLGATLPAGRAERAAAWLLVLLGLALALVARLAR